MQNKQPMQSEQLVQIAVAAVEDLKAQEIISIDVRGKTSITDFMVIASGSSSRQVKALVENVMEKVKEQGVRPLGSDREHAVDVRVISASHHDLDNDIRTQRFRSDLFFRLNVVALEMPMPGFLRLESWVTVDARSIGRIRGVFPHRDR